jgi:hypothetical protein
MLFSVNRVITPAPLVAVGVAGQILVIQDANLTAATRQEILKQRQAAQELDRALFPTTQDPAPARF